MAYMAFNCKIHIQGYLAVQNNFLLSKTDYKKPKNVNADTIECHF